MDNIIPTSEYTEFEDRYYANPQISLDRSNQFIDNLRATQDVRNQEIVNQTQNLGTEVPSNLGGLTGANSYFTSRYQTPQTNALVSNLRSTAQAAALNQALENEQAMWKKRYNEAYRNYQKRSWNKQNNPTTTTSGDDAEGEVDTTSNAGSNIKLDDLSGEAGKYTVVDPYTGEVTDVDMETGKATSRGGVTFEPVTKDTEGVTMGADQASDFVTWMWNYTLPGGVELELGGTDEYLKKGSNGEFYVWNKNDGKYTRVTGDSGKTEGGSRWWKKGQNNG